MYIGSKDVTGEASKETARVTERDPALLAERLKGSLSILGGIVTTEKALTEAKSLAASELMRSVIELDWRKGELIVAEFDQLQPVWEYPIGDFLGETTAFYATNVGLDRDDFVFSNNHWMSRLSIPVSDIEEVGLRIGSMEELPEDDKNWI